MGIRRGAVVVPFKKKLVCVAAGLIAACALASCATSRGPSDPKTARTYSQYLKGLVSDRLGEIDEAVAYYRQAQTADRTVTQFPVQLGLDYIRLGRYNEAITEFKKVVETTPDDDNARYVLALLYTQINDLPSAAGQYEHLLAKNLGDRTQNIRLRRILSQLYFLDKDLSPARRHGSAILDLDPADEYGLYFIAILDSEEGRVAQARQGFEKVLTVYPENTGAMNALAYLFAEQGIELVRALDLAEKAVAEKPSDAAYLDTLGWVYFKLGEVERAIGYLERASQLMLDPVILDHLKQAREKNIKSKGSHDAGFKKDP